MQIFEVFGDLVFRDNNTTERLNNLSAAVDSAQAGVQQFASNVLNIGSSLSNFGYSLIENVSKPIYNVVKDSVMLASDLGESFNVVDTTFGKDAKIVREWSKNLLDDFGLVELEANQYVGSMGAMLKSSGVSAKATRDMSMSLVELNGDMSSFYNLSHEETWEKIRSGISGETEPLKVLGINMSVANLEAYALSTGIEKAWKEMTQAEQVTLRYNYLMKVSKDSHGDFAKTADTFANQLRILSGRLTDMKVKLGNVLLPTVNKAVGKLIQIAEKVDNFGTKTKKIIGIIGVLAFAIGPVVVVAGTLITVIGGLIAAISAIGLPIMLAVSAVFAIIPAFVAYGAAVMAVLNKMGILKFVFDSISNLIKVFASVISNDVSTAFSILTEKLGMSSTNANVFIERIQNAKKGLVNLGMMIKNTSILLGQIFTGKSQGMIDTLINKFGISQKAAEKFAAKVQVLRSYVSRFGLKLRDIALNELSRFINMISKATKYVYKHRAEIVNAMNKILNFGIAAIAAMKKVYNGAKLAVSFAKIVYNSIKTMVRNSRAALNLLRDKVSGVLGGIKSKAQSVASAFRTIVSAVGSVIAKISSIKFPSPPSWLPGFATGVTNFTGGLAMVGEKGPELVQLPRGSNVIPNHQLKNYASKINPIQGLTQNLTPDKKTHIFNIEMFNQIAKEVDAARTINILMEMLKRRGVNIG